MRTRTIAAIAGIGIIAAAGVSVQALVTHAHSLAETAAASEVPAPDTSVEVMTKTYLRAAKDHDCALTRLLTTPNTFAWCGAGTHGWFDGDPELQSYRDVGKPELVTKGVAGHAQECVQSTIVQRRMSGADPGELSWSWCWVRTANGWRLWEQGQG